MIVIGIIGWKNSGKTFFAQRIIKKLTQKGINVASIKRAHHDFDIDKPGTDSYLHRQAGSQEVVVSSSRRWAKIVELREKNEKISTVNRMHGDCHLRLRARDNQLHQHEAQQADHYGC